MEIQQFNKKINVMNLMTLVLNVDYQPLSTWPLSLIKASEAVTRQYKDRIEVVETWEGAFFHSPSQIIPVPKTVVLKNYAFIFSEPKFSRRAILLRDRFKCTYCGKKFRSEDLTFDHLIPRAKGGKTTWENIVTACLSCNGKKGDKLPNYDGRKGVIRKDGKLRPLKMPHRPTNQELLKAGLESLPDSIKLDWGSWLYWETELIP